MIGKQDFSAAINECILRWPTLKGQVEVYYSHLNFMSLEAFEMLCQRFVEDFRSMPLPKDFKEGYAEWRKENFKKDPDLIRENRYQIHSVGNCRVCGKKATMCIEDPLGSDFECRQCYTGLTDKEIGLKFNELWRLMDAKSALRKQEWE